MLVQHAVSASNSVLVTLSSVPLALDALDVGSVRPGRPEFSNVFLAIHSILVVAAQQVVGLQCVAFLGSLKLSVLLIFVLFTNGLNYTLFGAWQIVYLGGEVAQVGCEFTLFVFIHIFRRCVCMAGRSGPGLHGRYSVGLEVLSVAHRRPGALPFSLSVGAQVDLAVQEPSG